MKSSTCAACRREVRWGSRGGRLAWWHQDDWPDLSITRDQRVTEGGSVSHEPILGRASSEVDWDAVATERARWEFDAENEQEDNRIFDIPPPEVTATEIHVTKPLDPRMPNGAKDLINAVVRAGGRARATYSKAARVHASQGNLLGMSDYVMVKFECDSRTGVAVWEDGALDRAYRTDYDPKTKQCFPTRLNSKPLRDWLTKGEE